MKNIYMTLIVTNFLFGCSTSTYIDRCSAPDDPQVYVPSIIYRSTFSDYQPQGPLKLQSWRKANEAVSNQPVNHMQHMNMPMTGSQENSMSPQKEDTSNHSSHGTKDGD